MTTDADPPEQTTRSGIPLAPFYERPTRGTDAQPAAPGSFPFTRGITTAGYRDASWIMGQYGGFGTPEESNERLKRIIEAGQTGFSVALDLPTQMGLDSDHPLAAGEVGRVGVPIDSLADMEILFRDVDLGSVRQLRTTANAIGHVWLALIVALCESQGTDPASLGVLIQNDVLKEYFARGTYVFPPRAGLSIVTDVVEYCAEHFPSWTPVTVSGYHIREAGGTVIHELAFSLADGIAYCDAAVSRHLDIDDFAPSLFAFLSSGIEVLEEVAKFRAVRLVWAHLMEERYGAEDSRSKALRIFAFTAGSSLAAQSPLNNVVRTSIEALGAVLGGVQTLHVSGYDEALGVPSAEAALLGLRSQQIILEEVGVAQVADPLGGSWAIEALTSEIADRVRSTLQQIEELGGALACIESGYFSAEIAKSAYEQQVAVDRGDRRIVGVNCHVDESTDRIKAFKFDPGGEQRQIERLRHVRASRNSAAVSAALDDLRRDAAAKVNIVPATIAAIRNYATVGEITDALVSVYGRFGQDVI